MRVEIKAMVHQGKTAPMYIYQLPINVNKKLCRLLDIDDCWMDLAHEMDYRPQTIAEIEQTARHHNTSPTYDLLTRWGQFNHNVPELFKLLYIMKHLPAMQCLEMQVEDRRLLRVLEKQYEKKQSGRRPTSTGQVECPTQKNDNTDFVRLRAPGLPMIPYEDLTEATNNWSADNLLGSGGFGTVYKGQWKELDIAIKRLNSKNILNEGLIRELWPNKYRHENLVSIYGYSLKGEESCVVYQLMTGESLAQRLYSKKTHHPPLTWTQRHRIAHGVAKGLLFLHEMGPTPLIHGDIKPANILLDRYALPKIGDFGIAREGDFNSENMTHLIVTMTSRQGTNGYLPNEYRSNGILSPALDVFSFGVVLMEMATRLRALQSGVPPVPLRNYILKQSQGGDLAALEDQMVFRKNPDLCRAFITLGLRCTENRRKRPTMLEVYRELDAMNIPSNPDF